MRSPLFRFRYTLLSTALIGATVLLSTAAEAAFDPQEGAAAYAPVAAHPLPDTSVLYTTHSRPLFEPGFAQPATASAAYAPVTGEVQMPARPLYPSRGGAGTITTAQVAQPTVITNSTVATVEVPSTIDPNVVARTQQLLDQEAAKGGATAAPAVVTAPAVVAVPVTVPAQAPASAGFVAPAPLIAVTPPTARTTPAPIVAAPVVMKAVPIAVVPVATGAVPVAPIVVAQPTTKLSTETRNILGKIPSNMDATPVVTGGSKITVERVNPEIKDILGKEAQEEEYESVGLSIKVRRPGLDTNYELNRAYTALMGGDTENAIQIYKDILGAEPSNQDALFGLAATYHRLGLIEKARPFYGMLLKTNPNHREGLNNFLVLVSDESPEDALPELQRLEERNPDFSPIPAQIALVYDKMGYFDQAQDKMLRAIELAPENLTYKYNLAIMLDRHGRYADAGALYRLLIDAGLRGEHVPAPLETLQKRLNYIVTAQTQAQAGG